MATRSRPSKPKEIFVSHSSKDHVAAERLVKVLQAHGIRVWFAPKHLLGAQEWHDEIGKALDRCDWFIVLISPTAIKSGWVKREYRYALQEERYEGRIVPIILRRCETKQLSWTLASMQRINFERAFESGCRELLRIWGIRYKP